MVSVFQNLNQNMFPETNNFLIYDNLNQNLFCTMHVSLGFVWFAIFIDYLFYYDKCT